MSNANWILKNGEQVIDCTSFPYAFRTMFNIVRKGIENNKPVDTLKLSILGPKNLRGDRTNYSYTSATALAREQGLLTLEGQINSREFKRR
jgi:hypothetical protein